MRRSLAALSLVAGLVTAAGPAAAAGALTIWQGPGGRAQWNMTWDSPSAQQARANSLNSCNNGARGQGATSGCRVVTEFRRTCLAFALQRNGFNGFGWATRSTTGAAQSAAMEACRRTRAGGQTCRIVSVNCDTRGG